MITEKKGKETKSSIRVGQLGPDEIKALKVEHKVDELHEIEVVVAKNDDGDPIDVAVGYIKEPNRNVVALAMRKMSTSDLVGAGDVIIANCFVAGDERLKTDKKVSIAAAFQAANAVDLLTGSIKKV